MDLLGISCKSYPNSKKFKAELQRCFSFGNYWCFLWKVCLPFLTQSSSTELPILIGSKHLLYQQLCFSDLTNCLLQNYLLLEGRNCCIQRGNTFSVELQTLKYIHNDVMIELLFLDRCLHIEDSIGLFSRMALVPCGTACTLPFCELWRWHLKGRSLAYWPWPLWATWSGIHCTWLQTAF